MLLLGFNCLRIQRLKKTNTGLLNQYFTGMLWVSSVLTFNYKNKNVCSISNNFKILFYIIHLIHKLTYDLLVYKIYLQK